MKIYRYFSSMMLTVFLILMVRVAWGQAEEQAASPTAGTTTRVSVASDGTEGNWYSEVSSISADGRYVAFESEANNLVSGDTNGRQDIFVHDTQTGQTTRVSVASDGTEGNSLSQDISISADGRYVAFESEANNLVSGDTNGYGDIFVHDTQTGQTTRVSVASDGTEGDYWPYYPSLSAEGRYTAFMSHASNLVSGDTNEVPDIFVHDTQTGQTTRVSVASDGTEGNQWSVGKSSLSADGRYVAFESAASNLVSGDTNGEYDIFVHDTQTGQTTRVSVASDGAEGNYWSFYPSLSADGRYVAFHSSASNLVSGDTNGYSDIFVHDTQTGQITRVSAASDGTEGNGNSVAPSLSADGRYLAFFSEANNLVSGDTNEWSDVFVHDRGGEGFSISGQIVDLSGHPLEDVQVETNTGDMGVTNSAGSFTITGVSAGTYTLTPGKAGHAFQPPSRTISVPPDATEVNFVGQNKPVVVLVHGFQGLTPNPLNCDDDNSEQSPIEVYHWPETPADDGMKEARDYWGDMPGWLAGEYDVWVAQLQTSRNRGTPPLGFNGECLRNQINYVVEQTDQATITLIGHSMGGLVSRACLNDGDCRNHVDTLVTLGSPHAGLPAGGLALILGIDCVWVPGVCQMSDKLMPIFNGINTNKSGIDYYFIGGDGSSGPEHSHQDKWNWLGAGPNDGLVGKHSAVGWKWIWPSFKWFEPWWWEDNSPPQQYWTDEFHSTYYSFEGNTQVRDDYYHARLDNDHKSNAYECFTILLAGNASPATCSPADTLLQTPAQTTALFQPTALLAGTLTSGQTLSPTLQIDTSSETTFSLSWYTGTITLTLKRPDGQVIDPAYAAANPGEVAYATGAGGAEVPPFATYSFTTTLPGIWTLVIDGTALGAPETAYWAYALLESGRTLTAGVDQPYFAIGDTATLTATLQSGEVGLSGITVMAEILRSDGMTETISLTDLGGGNYAASYPIPNAPGYLSLAIRAAGNDNGIAFTRQENMLVMVAPQNAQFTGAYSDQPEDSDGNGLYEWLHFDAEVNVVEAGDYIVSALLVSEDGQLISSVSTDVTLTTGIQTVTLSFDGDDLRNRQLDGPYTITNLQITEITLGIPSQLLENIHVTPAYSWQDFGRTMLSLPIFLPIVIK
ncbi:MAG: PD40 domain-containing protein [Anaerolineales bacterium]|nr:PD40 domain-containing protein [Anaerolineales bacterium]